MILFRIIKKIIKKIGFGFKAEAVVLNPIDIYLSSERIPWTEGYNEYKWKLINEGVNSNEILHDFSNGNLPSSYGIGVDERVIEYPWLISQIPQNEGKFLDAGSTFNFNEIINLPILENKETYIYTFYPESNNYASKRISYVYGDLRSLPFKDSFFDTVVCHSTLEHIDMDNSMYGYELAHVEDVKIKSYEYLKVINELIRVASKAGKVLLSFPYGKFENHGFFQQFDSEMVKKIEDTAQDTCTLKKSFVTYKITGWEFCKQEECDDAVSYNPHTGKGKGNDNAAHSRAICFLELTKLN
jgi:Methyltransferase domain